MTSFLEFVNKCDTIVSSPIVPDTTTENGGLAFSTTGSRCLDFFFGYVRNVPENEIIDMFKNAWTENPYVALKIVLNGRDCIGNGKQEKLISLYVMNFLRQWKPKTYIKNLIGFTNIGCYKDLLKLDFMGKSPIMPDVEIQLMASILSDDSKRLLAGEPITLMGKWVPTQGGEYDKKTKAARRIAAILKLTNMKEYRNMVTPLRTKIDILERLESEGRWNEIKFEKVPATAMMKQKSAFIRHCPESYNNYLLNVKAGKAKMNSKGIQPHDLVKNAADPGSDAQWVALVDRLKKDGVFKNCVALCDVSGSMSGIPMLVSISMGILLSSLNEGRFKNRILTFSEVTEWHTITGDLLHEKVDSVSQSKWGYTTNLIGAFELILDEAKKYELTSSQMIDKIIVFTDMQFNDANTGDYNTAFEIISKKYDEAGYKIPQIVFWNLRDSKVAFPVLKDTPGVALMSGFSPEMLKMFIDNEEISPYNIMMKALNPYKVFVVDE